MARNKVQIVIEEDGRDKGKNFVITEMPAAQAEKWGVRALLALTKSGVEIPDDIASAGFAGIASLGIKILGSMNWQDAEPLMDEMLRSCVGFIPDPARPGIVRGPGGIGAMVPEDIDEVSTLHRLRAEVWNIHAGFSIAAVVSALMTAATKTLGS